jgi:autotransporter-associated beta strand protein
VAWLTNWNLPCSLGDQDVNGTSSANRNPVSINNATLQYLGTNTTSDRYVEIGAAGATLDVTLAPTLIIMSGRFSGPGTLTKNGPGALQIQDNNNAYGGPTTLNNGLLRLTASGVAGTNTIVLAGGALQYSGGGFSLNNPINVTGSDVRLLVTNANNVSGGAWFGTGSVTVSNTGSLTFNTNIAAFGGLMSFGNSTGWFRFNNSTNDNNCRGSALATFDLGTGTAALSNFNGAGLTYDLGALMGGSGTILAGRSSNSTVWPAATTYQIGANGSNTAFNGRILNGQDTVSVTKVGPGTLLLNGANGYTGSTTVSAGTLGGTGTILGPVTVAASGTLSPGASIGTLTISNTLTLAGTTVIEVSKNGGVLSFDRVAGLTSATFGGALVVNNVGPGGLAEGDSFKIFSAGGTGAFSSITPALPDGLTWVFDAASGTLFVGPRVKLNYAPSGANSLTLSWPGSGYKLQSQTNSITTGIGTNWLDYPGGGTSPVTVSVDTASGTVFFRLISVP